MALILAPSFCPFGILGASGGFSAKPAPPPAPPAQKEKVPKSKPERRGAWHSKFEESDRNIQRLAPSDFPELPKDLSQNLELMGCTIPQPWRAKKPANVIQGQFSKPGEIDWAVLCSKDRVSTILVFWNGSPQSSSEISEAPDIQYLQDLGNNEIGFSRVISAVGEKEIAKYQSALGGPKPPSIDHQGIEDSFEGKASVINYYFHGEWLKLTGAD